MGLPDQSKRGQKPVLDLCLYRGTWKKHVRLVSSDFFFRGDKTGEHPQESPLQSLPRPERTRALFGVKHVEGQQRAKRPKQALRNQWRNGPVRRRPSQGQLQTAVGTRARLIPSQPAEANAAQGVSSGRFLLFSAYLKHEFYSSYVTVIANRLV